MLTYDEFKEAMDKGFIKGDTVQIVRLDGEQVEPREILSLEKHLTGASFLPAELVN